MAILNALERFSLHSPRCGRVDKSAHSRDSIGRNAHALGVFVDNRFVGGKIDAVHLVAGYITMEPLDLGTQSLKNLDRLLRDFPQLGFGQISRTWDFPFNHELWHGPSNVHRCYHADVAPSKRHAWA